MEIDGSPFKIIHIVSSIFLGLMIGLILGLYIGNFYLIMPISLLICIGVGASIEPGNAPNHTEFLL